MKKIILILFAILSFNMAQAKGAKQTPATVKGYVMDKDGQGLGFATVAIMNSDSTLVAGTTADENGYYALQSAAGNYRLFVSLIGYEDSRCNLSVVAPVTEMEPVVLQEDAQMLASSTITEKVKLVEVKIDKLVMNVGQSAFAQGSNALELMRKAPGVTIDKDGNVTLNGKAVSIWVDGRPSHLDGKALEALLRSTDGSSIDKFEIMEHPSSKYDAACQGGIINIKTKKNMLSGLNGNMGFDAGGMYFGKDIDKFYGKEGAWLNLAYRTANTNTFVNLYEGVEKNGQMETVDIFMDNDFGKLVQKSESLLGVDNTNWNVKLGNDWFINDKNILGFIVTAPGNIGTLSSEKGRNNTNIYINDILSEHTISDVDNPYRYIQGSANLNYTHVFNEAKAAELTANLDYYHNGGKNSSMTTSWDDSDAVVLERNIISDNTVDIYSAKVDYQSVAFGRFMMESGAKWAYSNTDNATQRTLESKLSESSFNYGEHIGAAYASFAGQLGAKVSFKAGLRGEFTSTKGNWEGARAITDRNYFDLFPTLFVGYNPNENWRFNATVTRRINRPDYNRLNPVEIYIDAHNCVVGNPDLQPEYDNVFAIGTGYKEHLNVTFAYDYTKDMMNQMPGFKDNGDAVMNWSNFGRRNIYLVSGNLTELPLAKWLTWTTNLTGMYVENVAGEYRNARPFLNAYTCFTAMLPKDWKIQLDGYYNSSMAWGYFVTEPMFSTNLGVRKNLLDGKMSLTFDIEDVLRSNNFGVKTLDEKGNETCYVGQIPYMQRVKVGLSWNFGTAQKTKARNVGNLEEMSRAGHSTSVGK